MTTPLNIAVFGMETASLAGGLATKLGAIRGAGFSQALLAASDLAGHPEGVEAALRCVHASGLRVTGLQALRDFEGLAGHLHAYKVEVARQLLELCHAVGSKLLLVSSSTSAHASDDPEAQARTLRQLAMLALPLGIRIAYGAHPGGRHVATAAAAWELVCRADMPNLGLAFDAGHALAETAFLDELDLLDPDRLFLVRLADIFPDPPPTNPEFGDAAAPFRVFPARGRIPTGSPRWCRGCPGSAMRATTASRWSGTTTR